MPERVAKLLRLWLVLLLSYLSVKLIVDLGLFGWIDLRAAAGWELLSIPAVQALVLWRISEQRRHTESPPS